MINPNHTPVIPTIPSIGKAALLEGVFSAEEMLQLDSESVSRAYWNVMPTALSFVTVDSVLSETRTTVPSAYSVLAYLSELALNFDDRLTMVRSVHRNSVARAHRDDLSRPAITFLVVMAGTVKYRLHGINTPLFHALGTEVSAQAGDVLCLNKFT